MAGGLESQVAKCMDANQRKMLDAVREQLYSGISGDGESLSPLYSNDRAFFDDPRRAGRFYRRPDLYIDWKMQITPPRAGSMLGLPPRDPEQPNLWIDGTFHRSITTMATRRGVQVYSEGFDKGPQIEAKYGSKIFGLSPQAVAWFNGHVLMPWLIDWRDTL